MAGAPDMDAPLSVDTWSDAGAVTIRLSGELDIASVPRVEEALVPIERGGRLVLDLRELSFIDSSGVRLLMTLDVRGRTEGWKLVIARRPGPVQNVLDLCGVAARVATVDDPADDG